MQERSENDSSSGAILITGPYFSWALAMTRLLFPETSLSVSHLVVILARKGPGMLLSGDRNKLKSICGEGALFSYFLPPMDTMEGEKLTLQVIVSKHEPNADQRRAATG